LGGFSRRWRYHFVIARWRTNRAKSTSHEGLQTHIATTESVSFCVRMKS
jgi:hypothetical protein